MFFEKDRMIFSHARIITHFENTVPVGTYGTVRVPFHVSGMRCVFARNHESERASRISASLSLSSFCTKTQRIPDTWDSTLRRVASHDCVLTQLQTQNHESERDAQILLSLLYIFMVFLFWFCYFMKY